MEWRGGELVQSIGWVKKLFRNIKGATHKPSIEDIQRDIDWYRRIEGVRESINIRTKRK